jgi:hypothetical protein
MTPILAVCAAQTADTGNEPESVNDEKYREHQKMFPGLN